MALTAHRIAYASSFEIAPPGILLRWTGRGRVTRPPRNNCRAHPYLCPLMICNYLPISRDHIGALNFCVFFLPPHIIHCSVYSVGGVPVGRSVGAVDRQAHYIQLSASPSPPSRIRLMWIFFVCGCSIQLRYCDRWEVWCFCLRECRPRAVNIPYATKYHRSSHRNRRTPIPDVWRNDAGVDSAITPHNYIPIHRACVYKVHKAQSDT